MDYKIRSLQRRAACGDGDAADKLYHMGLYPEPPSLIKVAWVLTQKIPWADYSPANVSWVIERNWWQTREIISRALGSNSIHSWGKYQGDVEIEEVLFRLLPIAKKYVRRLTIKCPVCGVFFPIQAWRKHAKAKHFELLR